MIGKVQVGKAELVPEDSLMLFRESAPLLASLKKRQQRKLNQSRTSPKQRWEVCLFLLTRSVEIQIFGLI